jgi:hypothetical protein
VKGSGDHLEVIRCPSIAECDDHEEFHAYFRTPQVDFFRLDERGRICGRETVFLDSSLTGLTTR